MWARIVGILVARFNDILGKRRCRSAFSCPVSPACGCMMGEA